MMTPNELITLAEYRRQRILEESHIEHLREQLPTQPARWRQWAGGSMIWTGALLVTWGQGMEKATHSHRIEVSS